MIVALTILIATIAAALIAYAFLESELSAQAEKTLPLTPFVPETEEMYIEDDDAPALDATAEWFAEGDRDLADQIREEYALGNTTYGELSERFSLSKSTIGRIVRHEWRA